MLDQGPTAEMSGFFKDMDLRKGLNLLAETNGMSVREKDGVYTFYREAWSSAAKDGGRAPRLRAACASRSRTSS